MPQGAYRPALDGIRALAVAAVLWFHLGRLPGGNLGVDAFFVVSGWLITWKLLDEADRVGGIDLRRFWTARARRLLPASLSVLVAVALVWPLAGVDVPSLRRDLVFAAGWISNWGTITSGGDYWARFGEPSPVSHFWSLAIEEQFYLVWPALVAVVVAATRRRRSRGFVASLAGVAALGSIVFMWVTVDPADPTATYMHTLARAHSLLLGAAAAAATPLLASGRLRRGALARRLAPLGALAAAGIVTAVSISGHDPTSTAWMFRWGHPAFALAMVPVVVAAADGAGSRVLAAPAMRWVADRSYGLYLWHWPVFLLLTPTRVGIDGALATAGLDAVRVAVAVALADVSLRWLESPVRRRRALLTWRAPVAAATTMVVIAVLAVSLVPGSPASSSDAVVTLPPPSTSTAASSSPAASPPTSSAATHVLDDARASAGPVPTTAGPATTADAESADIGSAPSTGPLRVLVTGDSTAVHLSEALIAYAATVPDELLVGSGAFPGCGLTAADDGRMHEFTDTDGSRDLIDLSGCVTQFESVPERVVAEAVDVVLVVIGPWDAVDVHLPDGEVVSVADAAGRRLVSDAYRRFATATIAAGADVVWVTPADAHLGWGEVDDPVNDPARWNVLRGVLDELTVDLGVVQIDLPGWLAANDLSGPEGRPDGIHLGPGLNERFVVDEVIPTLAATHLHPGGQVAGDQLPSSPAV